jgi:hypothetical protein
MSATNVTALFAATLIVLARSVTSHRSLGDANARCMRHSVHSGGMCRSGHGFST